jgi:hypothetical protein
MIDRWGNDCRLCPAISIFIDHEQTTGIGGGSHEDQHFLSVR